MSEKITMFTKNTLIPFGLALSLALGAMYYGRLTEKVDSAVFQISRHSAIIDELPSREEFNQMKSDITEIKGDMKIIMQAI